MCKMAHFGNCDPETADQEYCIFHKPNKTEEEAREFWEKFLERINIDFEEIEVEDNTGKKRKLHRPIFKDVVNVRGFVFPSTSKYGIFFRYSIFEREANFRYCIFEDNVSFDDAIFSQGAYFGGSIFEKDLYCGNTQFLGESDFDEVHFKEDAYFDKSHFHNNAYFGGAIFERDAYFDDAIFESEVSFASSSFDGDAYFQRTIFKGNADFRWSQFKKNGYFEGVPSEKFKFYDYLKFSGARFSMLYIDIPSGWFKLPEAEIEARRVQRLSYEKEGRREDADRMFILEMRAKRKARLKNAHNKLEKIKANTHNFIEWLLADLPSEYGTNWVRLFLVSLLVILGNAVPYAIWSNLIEGFPETSNYFVRFANALYYSLVTFTTLGYGDMHPTGWLKALSGLEALTGAVFMALIVAVIARKWMR